MSEKLERHIKDQKKAIKSGDVATIKKVLKDQKKLVEQVRKENK